MGEALDVFQEHYDLYPLWICPYRAYDYASGITLTTPNNF